MRELIGKLGEVYLPNDCSELGCSGVSGALDSGTAAELAGSAELAGLF
jgi:hypothetical protein